MRVRRATAADAGPVADVFLASFEAAYPLLPRAHSDGEVRSWIAGHVVAETECWISLDGRRVVAMMSLTPGWIDHLYVAPDRLGQGIGRRLLDLAKARADGALQLWTYQINERARRFYERNGFEVAELTDGSGNEDHLPDVRYVWTRR